MTHSQFPQPSEDKGRLYPHLNFRWSIADMDRIAAMARARNSAQHIAVVLNCTSAEIHDVCRRNGIAMGRL